MSKNSSLNVRLGETLTDFVSTNVGRGGSYENASEYVRDLIRRDKERRENEAFERLKAELHQAFAQPRSAYRKVTAKDIVARNARR